MNDEQYQNQDTVKFTEKTKWHTIFLVFVIVALVGILVFFGLKYSEQTDVYLDETVVDEYPKPSEESLESREIINESLLGNNPTKLVDSLVGDIKSQNNDEYTKTHAYFLTHRFYDNGGNIYEIYDYIERYPELAFLKEAEKIYPDFSDAIKAKQLPSLYTDRANLVNMAYSEILDKHGYSSAAMLSTLANQYAKTAFFLRLYAKEDVARRSYFTDLAQQIDEKSKLYVKRAQPLVEKIITEPDSTDLTAHDKLIGLNQYGSALRYLAAQGIEVAGVDQAVESKKVFDHALALAKKEVTELVSFTSLLNASTLILAGNRDGSMITVALEPIISFDTKVTPVFKGGPLDKIIKAKDEIIPVDMTNRNLDVYGKSNVLSLAEISPDFKDWLIENGWQEQYFVDFAEEALFLDKQTYIFAKP